LYYLTATTVTSDAEGIPPWGIFMLQVSRVLLGAGMANPLLFQYLTFSVKPWARIRFDLIFILLNNFGQWVGPGIQSLLLFVPFGEDGCRRFLGTDLCDQNILALFTFCVWIIFLPIFVIFYKGHERYRRLKRMKYLFNLRQPFKASGRYGVRFLPASLSLLKRKRRLPKNQLFQEIILQNKMEWLSTVNPLFLVSHEQPEGDPATGLPNGPFAYLEAMSKRSKSLDAYGLGLIDQEVPLIFRRLPQSFHWETNDRYQLSAIPDNPFIADPKTLKLHPTHRLTLWNSSLHIPRYRVRHPVRYMWFLLLIILISNVI
jgi:hypothetical protein